MAVCALVFLTSEATEAHDVCQLNLQDGDFIVPNVISFLTVLSTFIN